MVVCCELCVIIFEFLYCCKLSLENFVEVTCLTWFSPHPIPTRSIVENKTHQKSRKAHGRLCAVGHLVTSLYPHQLTSTHLHIPWGTENTGVYTQRVAGERCEDGLVSHCYIRLMPQEFASAFRKCLSVCNSLILTHSHQVICSHHQLT